ncbi:transglutaminase domain-containing protein [bacterium]|nr:transglutaminase domain-containing protein [bacterium]
MGIAILGLWLPACNSGGATGGLRGLKPGLNYMQPLKWRLTYRYRVREIIANRPYIRERPSTFDPTVPAAGPGTYEVWMVGPRNGDEIRGMKCNYASPEPTQITPVEGGIDMIYYDFAPDGNLPQEITAAIQWEFYTFERYAYWEGMDIGEYDKDSELYKEYTKVEYPITTNKVIRNAVNDLIPKEHPEDYITTALGCYNYVVCNFEYDFSQPYWVMYNGGQAMHDSTRCWENRTGVCDEFANVMCSMLRTAGIPARPVAGIVHLIDEYDEKTNILVAGGHAWAEFYLPDIGWVPLDPTWGMDTEARETIKPYWSMMGSARGIPQVDYYFGKHDPYRITMFKNWNMTLTPAPKTPDADTEEMWFVGHTDRFSGIREVEYGWEGQPGIGGG